MNANKMLLMLGIALGPVGCTAEVSIRPDGAIVSADASDGGDKTKCAILDSPSPTDDTETPLPPIFCHSAAGE